MAKPQGVVRVHQEGPTLMIQVDGWATMVQSLPLRRYVEHALTKGVAELRLDLGPCQYMDSTFLGTLFLLKRMLGRHGQVRLGAVSASCLQLLQQMGVESLFPPVNEKTPPNEQWLDLEGGGPEACALQRNVIQAHQELASMDGKIGDTFRPVAQCLAREMDTRPEL